MITTSLARVRGLDLCSNVFRLSTHIMEDGCIHTWLPHLMEEGGKWWWYHTYMITTRNIGDLRRKFCVEYVLFASNLRLLRRKFALKSLAANTLAADIASNNRRSRNICVEYSTQSIKNKLKIKEKKNILRRISDAIIIILRRISDAICFFFFNF